MFYLYLAGNVPADRSIIQKQLRGPFMPGDSFPTVKEAINQYNSYRFNIKDYLARNKVHIVLIVLCALLLLGDFVTTSMALSLSGAGAGDVSLIIEEGNPLMAEITHTPLLFLFAKFFILQVVIAAAYFLRKEGAIAYFPCVLVCSFYIWVNMNNINILATALI